MFKILSTILFAAVRFGGCIAFAWWLCDISSSEHYEWLSGAWHGIMFVPNWLRSLFSDGVLYKAVDYSTGYNVAWWIFCILSCIGTLFDVLITSCLSLGKN